MVIFQAPEDPKKVYIKRIVAIGGDIVEIRGKRLFINTVETNHAFARFVDPEVLPKGDYDNRDNFSPITVPKEKVFILGDNRDDSLDSRVWGCLDKKTIRGGFVFTGQRTVTMADGGWAVSGGSLNKGPQDRPPLAGVTSHPA